jgi:ATP-dependent Clp protease ATP-binding subunit ClpC
LDRLYFWEQRELEKSIKNNPFSVILFDEIEKAHKDVYNIFLQIFDEGRITDSFGKRVDFTNTLIIMTSNVGSRRVSEFGNGVGFISSTTNIDNQKKSIIRKSLKQQFNPEFLNRIDDIVMFNSLGESEIKKIISIEIGKLIQSLKTKNYIISFSESVLNRIFELNIEEDYGARPIKRVIQNLCEDYISENILRGNIKESTSYVLKIDENNDLSIE